MIGEEIGQNGARRMTSGILRFEHVVPLRKPLVIGEREYAAWAFGKRCPRSIKAAVQAAYDTWQAERGDGTDPASAAAAWNTFLTTALIEFVPGLTYQEADLLDEDEALEILRYVGYLKTPDAPATEEDDATDPPATAVTETTT